LLEKKKGCKNGRLGLWSFANEKMNIAKFCGYRFLSWEIFDLKKGV
jgi:hypothetical protein